jgi:hypothetical protein
MTGLNSQLPRSEMPRTLNDLIARKDAPTPKAGFDLLHIVINGAVFHELLSLPLGRPVYTNNSAPVWLNLTKVSDSAVQATI